MSWIRSEQSLLYHPKTKLLQGYLKTTLPETIGRLHLLWYWCLDYAFDGDLSKKTPQMIQDACQIPLKLLVRAGFVDSRPYRRIHGWYEIQGNYLRARFKDSPDKWKRIKELYETDLPLSLHRLNKEGNNSGNNPRSTTDVQNRTNGRTDGTDGRTLIERKEKEKRAGYTDVSPALTAVIENDEAPEFGHDDFVRLGWLNSEIPNDNFGWQRLERSLSDDERVMSKYRERKYIENKLL